MAGRKLPVRKLVSVTTRSSSSSSKWRPRTLLLEQRTHMALLVRQLPTARHVMHQPKGSRPIPSSRGYHCLSSSSRNSSSNQSRSRDPGFPVAKLHLLYQRSGWHPGAKRPMRLRMRKVLPWPQVNTHSIPASSPVSSIPSRQPQQST